METLHKILQGSLKVWVASEIPPSQCILPLTWVGCTQSTGDKQEAQDCNLTDTPGAIQAQITGIIQLDHKKYQY